ncbi:MAG: ABC transporter permease [Firmicutes bacterium]|nr:ABC transporter permease [Bacillota bacterium]
MLNFLSDYQLNFLDRILLPAIKATFEMLIYSTILSVIFGFLVGVLLVVTNKGGILQNRFVYGVLSFIVNVIRSFPVIILIVFMLPMTKAIVGTSIGVAAAVVPLTVSATAFIAKLIESSLQEVDKELVEAMHSFGLSDAQVIFKVMFSEALPSMLSGVIIATISILSATAVAGAVGAGGLGSVAITYGYQSFNNTVMYITVGILIILVQIIQSIGDLVYRKMKS